MVPAAVGEALGRARAGHLVDLGRGVDAGAEVLRGVHVELPAAAGVEAVDEGRVAALVLDLDEGLDGELGCVELAVVEDAHLS